MKAYTDLEQSKKLAEILPIESADMWYWHFPTAPTYNDYGYPMFHKGEDIRNVPCWSLAALLGVLPNKLQIALAINDFQGDRKEKYAIGSVEHDKYDCFADNPVDACYEMIIKLHEQELL